MTPEERWKDIPGYEGQYQVSDQGRIKSFAAKVPYLRKLNLSDKGYFTIMLSLNNKSKRLGVHRLVMLAFVGPSELEVNHKNAIKTDNRLENLEYVTHSGNMKHAFDMGLMKLIPKDGHGENNTSAKLKKEDIILIRKIGRKWSQQELATLFNVNRSLIGYILNRKLWKHI